MNSGVWPYSTKVFPVRPSFGLVGVLTPILFIYLKCNALFLQFCIFIKSVKDENCWLLFCTDGRQKLRSMVSSKWTIFYAFSLSATAACPGNQCINKLP